MTPRRIRWFLGLASAAAFTWASLLLLGANPLGLVLLALIPVLLALAHRPTKDLVLTIAGVASGPILVAFVVYVSGRYLDGDAFLSPTYVVREMLVEFPVPMALSISWAFVAWRAPRTHRWVRHRYQWWPAPVCAWGVASLAALRYYVLEAHLYDFPLAARFDILWLGVWSSLVGLVVVVLPLAPIAARSRSRGSADLLLACLVVLVVAVEWVFHLSLLSRIWLSGR